MEYKWGTTVGYHTKIWGNAQEFCQMAPKVAKNVYFSVTKITSPFGHLSSTDLEYFWNSWCESVSQCIHQWKNQIFAWGCFASSQNEKNGVISRECLLSVCSSNSTILDDRIHFTSQRCTFCMWVLVRNVQFGHLFPRKTQFLCWMQMVHPFTVHQR